MLVDKSGNNLLSYLNKLETSCFNKFVWCHLQRHDQPCNVNFWLRLSVTFLNSCRHFLGRENGCLWPTMHQKRKQTNALHCGDMFPLKPCSNDIVDENFKQQANIFQHYPTWCLYEANMSHLTMFDDAGPTCWLRLNKLLHHNVLTTTWQQAPLQLVIQTSRIGLEPM